MDTYGAERCQPNPDTMSIKQARDLLFQMEVELQKEIAERAAKFKALTGLSITAVTVQFIEHNHMSSAKPGYSPGAVTMDVQFK